jgi:hypothetical protein
MKTRQVLGSALSLLLLAAALPASADLECSCENGEVVETVSDDPADCDDACLDLAGSRSADHGQNDVGETAEDSAPARAPAPDDGPRNPIP